ncbi:MAG: PPOX class F420-dependent oxidoreductase [Pseudonocardiaceae bacterium]
MARSSRRDSHRCPGGPARTSGEPFASLAVSSTALLTTYRRNGDPVPTPVSIVLDGGRAYFVSAVDSGKAKRLVRNPHVTLAPCTTNGEVLGEPVGARVRLLEGAERRQVRRLLRRPTTAMFWSYVGYRLGGKTMNLYEGVPTIQPG